MSASNPNDLLHEKCTRLHTRAQVQAARITELENTVKKSEEKRTEYEDVTIKLRGLWDQLCEDLSLLAEAALCDLVGKESLPKQKLKVNTVSCNDPFLAALVSSDAAIAEECFKDEARLAEEFSAVEAQLQERANNTRQYLQQLLELVRDLRDRASGPHVSHVHGTSSVPTNGSRSHTAHSDVHFLRGKVESHQGRVRTLQADVRHSRGQLAAERNRCQDLENQIADKEAEIDVLRKREYRAQEQRCTGNSMNTAVPLEAGNAQYTGGLPGESVALSDCKKHLEEAHAELKAERDAHCETRQSLQSAEDKFANEASWVSNTGMYQRQAAELKQLQDALATAVSEKSQAESEMKSQSYAFQSMRKEFSQVTRLTSIEEERAQRLEVQLHKVRADALKQEAELIQERDARGEQETYGELKKFVETYETVRLSLTKCLEALEASRKAKVDDVPNHCEADAARRSAAAEQELRSLTTRAVDAEASAIAHRNAHNDVLVSKAELESMLAVVCAFTEDPRDLIECRAAERRAQAELACARAAAAAAASSAGLGEQTAAAMQNGDQSAIVDAGLWRMRAESSRNEAANATIRMAGLEREVQRLTEEMEQAKEYEGEMVREVSDTGQAFAKLQSERAKVLELLTTSDAKLQAKSHSSFQGR